MAKIAYVDWDQQRNVLYVALGDKNREERDGLVTLTKVIGKGVHIDYDKDDNIVGIEVI